MPASHTSLANALRFLAIDAVEQAKSGHPGLPMGMADVATVLFTQFLKYDPARPDWPDRDRFILSAGHGSMLLYALAYLTGYEKMTLDEIKRFRQLGSLTPGHPEHDISIGVETTTGPLGQGLGNSIGFAIAERMLNAKFGNDLVNHRTYVLASDGDLMEGLSHEACSLAGHLKLDRLIVLYDDNKVSIDGPTALSFSDNTEQRFQSYGWQTQNIDGHDPADIADALTKAQHADHPMLIICRTQIGYGAPNKCGTSSAHGSPLGADETKLTREKLLWNHPAFHVPEDTLNAWRAAGKRSHDEQVAWEGRLRKSPDSVEFMRRIKGELPKTLIPALEKVKAEATEKKPNIATRVASGNVLAALIPALPELVGGSADLTPSNNTKTKDESVLSAANLGGRYIHFGVREHAMAAAMNGIALHGGFIPYGGTFLQFADYCRPSIRLACLMKQRVIYVMTHDSIGLGEDGPTHQPVGHLSAYRGFPNIQLFRPCDSIETAECWQLALEYQGPSMLCLSRQNLPTLRRAGAENMSAKGGYVIHEEPNRALTILSTGSEVSLAMTAREMLAKEGIYATVVSIPSFELFNQQPEAYRREVLGTAPRIACEAATRGLWDQYLREGDHYIGMPGFGASAPAEDLYKHFGITAEALVAKAISLSRAS